MSLIGSQTIIRTNGTHLFFTYRTFNTCETTMAIKAHTIVTSKVNSRPMDSACGVLQTVVHHIQLPALHEVLGKMHGVQDCVTHLTSTRPRRLESSGLKRRFMRAYKRSGGGACPRESLQKLKTRLKRSYITVLINKFFEFTRLFKLGLHWAFVKGCIVPSMGRLS